MITAVDTNVLLDLLTADPVHGEASQVALIRARSEGALVLCEVVYAELAAAFAPHPNRLAAFLADAGLHSVRTPEPALAAAGGLWRAYRDRGGQRTRVVADLLVAAHADAVADRLLSRDRGMSSLAPPGLEILDPRVFSGRDQRQGQ